MGDWLHDIRRAARSLRRSPSFAGITVVTLSLGIGILTAGFAVVQAVLLRPITADQDQVLRIWKTDLKRGGHPLPFAYPEFAEIRDRARAFTSLSAINYADAWTVTLDLDRQSTLVALTPVSPEFFETLRGGKPLYGRYLTAADALAGAETAVVASERFWKRVTGGDPAFLGRRLVSTGGGWSALVVGVAPAALDYPLGTDLWAPIPRLYSGEEGRFDSTDRRFAQFELLGRLRPGTSPDEARAELETLGGRLSREFPDDYPLARVVAEPLVHVLLGQGRTVLLFLFAAGGLVFLIAGVNAASLLLMRAASREKEVAVRRALGASRGRLAREAIVESLLLSCLSAVSGLMVARWSLVLVQWLAPDRLPRLEQARLDAGVVAFAIAVALGWVVALGTAPLWGRRRFAFAPGSGSHGLSLRGARSVRGLWVFTIAQTAVALLVVAAAFLLVRSFVHLQRIERGFEARNLALIQLVLPDRYHDARSRLAFFDELVRRVSAVPGVESASPDHTGPAIANAGLRAPMKFEGQSPEEAAANPWASWEPVRGPYFRTLGIPIVRGRDFEESDAPGSAQVAIVSASVARRYWPGQDPLGKRLRLGADFPWVTVVGVAADVRYRELTRTWLTVYFPAAQFFFFQPGYLAVRTAGPSEALLPTLQAVIRAQDPRVGLQASATMETLLARELARPRTALAVTAIFGAMAIFLAGVGAYGVLSYEVTERGHELAVRSALGASPARIFETVVGRSLRMGSAGIAIGVQGALLMAPLIEPLLFEVGPFDPGALAFGAGFVLVVGLLAALVPARRAAGADPAILLRAQ